MDEKDLKRHCDDVLIERIDSLTRAFETFVVHNEKTRDEFKAQNKEEHAFIIAQTTKTNGSVAKAFLEIETARKEFNDKIVPIKSWQDNAIGAVQVIAFLIGGGLLTTLIFYLITR